MEQKDDKKQPLKAKNTFLTTQDPEIDRKQEKDRKDEEDNENRERIERERKEREEMHRRMVIEEKARHKQQQALLFDQFVEHSGLKYTFQIIFIEIINKQIQEDQVFAYAAMRLRQIGQEIDGLDKMQPERK